MAWINSQLKKKPGARLVEDLRNDTRDGVAFIELISVIGRKVCIYLGKAGPKKFPGVQHTHFFSVIFFHFCEVKFVCINFAIIL